MGSRKVDVAILGAGTAGLAAYRKVRDHTDSVVLIEGGAYGTTCARVGCMPSKLLIAAADAAYLSEHAKLFGVTNTDTHVDGKAVMGRVRYERDRFVQYVLESIETIPAAHKIQAYAHFQDQNALLLSNGEKVFANSVIIATGSRPYHPPVLHEAGDKLLTNESIFDLEDLPKSVAVFGPGVIGLELGQALSRLGVHIKLFGVGGYFGAIQDPKIKNYALGHFSKEFYIDTDAKVERLKEVDDGVVVYYEHCDNGITEEKFDYVLAATGRRPNVDKLHLKNTRLALDERGIPKFDPFTLQCGDSNIFIAGDVNSYRPVLHEAADEGKIAGQNAVFIQNGVRAGLRRAPMAVVFSDPQIAAVGLSVQEVESRGSDCFAVGEVSFENQGRSRVMGQNKGLLRVYAEQGSGLFLGAEMIGPRAEHIAHLLSWALQQRLTVSQMLEMPYYHPVVEEGLRTALRDLNAKLKIGPEFSANCLDCGPGT